ncbi:MAG: hypothetical protein QNK04_15130 [Myxococcota bacterium]|nr:hypothetical protein [Myxococcota bacterium]
MGETRTKRLVVYVDPPLFKKLQAIAEAESRTVSSLVYVWLREQADEWELA